MSLCSWVHALYKFYFVNKETIPKIRAVKEANDMKREMDMKLKAAKMEVKKVSILYS